MENYYKLCPKFLDNPNINPINNLPIVDDEFDYYRYRCKTFGYEFPPEKTLDLMYKNKYYGMKVCRDFLEDNTINPITGGKIYKGTEDYNGLIKLCNYYKFDTSVLGEIKSIKSKSKRKNYLGQLPLELESQILPIPKTNLLNPELLPIPKRDLTRISETKLLTSDKRSVVGSKSLLPIPKRDLLPIPSEKRSVEGTKSLLPISSIKKKEDDLLMNLKMIAKEIPKDKKVKKVVMDSLNIILQKNSDYDGESYTMSGTEKRYGTKQFVFDLLINEEIDLVTNILDFYGLQYIDILKFLFDFKKYITNESLIINYFINAPPNTNWLELEDSLEEVYSNWLIKEKLNLLTILLTSSIAVGNEFLTEFLIGIFNSWRESFEEEIDDIDDDDMEEKDQLINMVEILDTLSIR